MRRALFLATALVLTSAPARADRPKHPEGTGSERASLYITSTLYAGALAFFFEALPRGNNVYAGVPPIEAALVVPFHQCSVGAHRMSLDGKRQSAV